MGCESIPYGYDNLLAKHALLLHTYQDSEPSDQLLMINVCSVARTLAAWIIDQHAE